MAPRTAQKSSRGVVVLAIAALVVGVLAVAGTGGALLVGGGGGGGGGSDPPAGCNGSTVPYTCAEFSITNTGGGCDPSNACLPFTATLQITSYVVVAGIGTCYCDFLNISVNWGDGTTQYFPMSVFVGDAGYMGHDFPANGTYEVTETVHSAIDVITNGHSHIVDQTASLTEAWVEDSADNP